MINISSIIPTVLSKIKKLPVGNFIDLQTYKKDRSVTIVKKSENVFVIIEKGYFQKTFEVEANKLKKVLKTLLKKEFPRSNKVRMYSGEYNLKG